MSKIKSKMVRKRNGLPRRNRSKRSRMRNLWWSRQRILGKISQKLKRDKEGKVRGLLNKSYKRVESSQNEDKVLKEILKMLKN